MHTYSHTHARVSYKNFQPSGAWDATQCCSERSLPTWLWDSSANDASLGGVNEPEDLSLQYPHVIHKHELAASHDTLMGQHIRTQRWIWSEQKGQLCQLMWLISYLVSARYCLISCSSFPSHHKQTSILLQFGGTWIIRMHAHTYNVSEWNGHSVALWTLLGAAAWGCMSNAQICPTTESYTHPHNHTRKPTDNPKSSPFST